MFNDDTIRADISHSKQHCPEKGHHHYCPSGGEATAPSKIPGWPTHNGKLPASDPDLGKQLKFLDLIVSTTLRPNMVLLSTEWTSGLD